jgi:hypothetical protein
LRRSEYLNQTQKLELINLNLCSHQSKGLAMMLEKERGDLVGTQFGTMWIPTTLSSGYNG